MGLEAVVDRVRAREKTLTVYVAPDTDIVEHLQEHFATQNLELEAVDADGRPEHAVLSDDGEVLTAVGIDALHALTDGPRDIGEDVPYSPLLEHLNRATFTSHSRRQMLEASREIEDRAWRAERGTLYAGFQDSRNFEQQRDPYQRLGARDIEVHVYVGDDSLDAPSGVHAHSAPELSRWWFVVYDNDDEQQSSALIAEEQSDGRFYGVWTYEADLVADAVEAISTRRQSA
jgi:DICT domain-containing protein